MAAALASGTGQLLVTGYAEHDFGDEPGLEGYYEQSSEAHSLLGLQWRLCACVVRLIQQPFVGMLRPHFYLNFEDAGEEGTTTVYSATVKISVLLPNGQLLTEMEDKVRHRFRSAQIFISGHEHPELDDFIGQLEQLLCESFTVRADIEVFTEPTILHSPKFHHAIKVSPFEDCWGWRMSVAGYAQHRRRLVFWIVTEHTVTCWAANPLVPSSLERLCRHRETDWSYSAEHPNLLPAALSIDQHVAACVTRNTRLHFYVLLLDTNGLRHQQYDIRTETHWRSNQLNGLAHTTRGWIMWVSSGRFYRLVENELQLILRVEAPTASPPLLAANYDSLFASFQKEDRFEVWDLTSPELNSHSYNHQLDRRHEFLGCGDKMLVLEYGVRRDFTHVACGVLSKIGFGENECKVESYGSVVACDSIRNVVFDEGKVTLVWIDSKWKEIVVQTVWMGGHVPTAKEMATMEIQKRTGRQEMMETGMGEQSVWQGGITEQKIREIVSPVFKLAAIMN